MKSSTGRDDAHAPGLNAAQMPSGIPISSAITVATITDAIVCIVSNHRSIDSDERRPTAEDRGEHDLARGQPARGPTRPRSSRTGFSAVSDVVRTARAGVQDILDAVEETAEVFDHASR